MESRNDSIVEKFQINKKIMTERDIHSAKRHSIANWINTSRKLLVPIDA